MKPFKLRRRLALISTAGLLCAGVPAMSVFLAPAAHAATCTITQDASTPAPVTSSNGSGTLTTASFTPPAGSLLVLEVGADAGALPTISASDTAGHTWTLDKSAQNSNADTAKIYTAPVPSSGATQVKVVVGNTGGAYSALESVQVLDGTASSQSGAASSSAIGSGTGLYHGITTTTTGSWVVAAGNANHAESSVTPLSTTSTLKSFNDTGNGDLSISGKQASATGTPGTENIGWNLGTSTQLAFVGQEILPATNCGGTAPAVTTTAATGVTSSGATLNGTVNPEGAATTYQFQYGPTTSYGSVAPASPGSAGSGSSSVNESAAVSGLSASTTYHYRLTATNATGTTNGSDQTLTTSATGSTHFMDFGPSAACPDGSGTGCGSSPNTYPLSASTCANSIVPDNTERIPENATQNATTGPSSVSAANYGPWTDNTGEPQMMRDIQAASGQYTGTTDNILEWAACSEGWNENWLRAEAVVESSWQQSTQGDSGCSQGILQVRACQNPPATLNDAWGGYPLTHNSTAFAAEMQASYLRACFDGSIDYLYPSGQTVSSIAAAHGGGTNPTGAGWQYVAWGCVGSWFSGDWYSSAAQSYISQVQSDLTNQSWNGLS